MSSIFQDITFEFQGEQYSITANTVFPLIAQIDEVMPLSELLSKDKIPSVVKICKAFSICIKYAGGNVETEQVYNELFGENPVNPRDVVLQLQMFVVPPAKYIITTPQDSEDIKKSR